MAESPLHVLAVVGSLNKKSITRVVVSQIAADLKERGCEVDLLDLLAEPLPLFDPENARRTQAFPPLQSRVDRADVYILGTPDYHGSISSALKNFLDHFWHEFAGKLFAAVVASHEKGLTVVDQMRTVARQCYAWSLPYCVSFADREDIREGQIVSASLKHRLEMLARDVDVYGSILARQRRVDLGESGAGFMARHRPRGA